MGNYYVNVIAFRLPTSISVMGLKFATSLQLRYDRYHSPAHDGTLASRQNGVQLAHDYSVHLLDLFAGYPEGTAS
jgi:hypothetical protein